MTKPLNFPARVNKRRREALEREARKYPDRADAVALKLMALPTDEEARSIRTKKDSHS